MIISVLVLPVSAEETTEKMNLEQYMNYLPGYFYDTYNAGDEIAWKGVLGIFELYCHANADTLDFATVEDPDVTNMVYLKGAGFREFAKILLGDSFDPDLFLDAEETSMKYNADTDTYSYSMAKDYWGENPLYNSRTVEITDGDDNTTVTVEITTGNEANGVPYSFIGVFEYKFKHIEYKGIIYYQLEEITLVSDTAPQTGTLTAALAIVAIASGAYVVTRRRR